MKFKIWLPHPFSLTYIQYCACIELGLKDLWPSIVNLFECSVIYVIAGDYSPLSKDRNGNAEGRLYLLLQSSLNFILFRAFMVSIKLFQSSLTFGVPAG